MKEPVTNWILMSMDCTIRIRLVMANKGRQISILGTLAYIELGSILDTYLPTPTLGRIVVNKETLLGNRVTITYR